MDARKNRYGSGDLADLFAGSSTLIACRGKKSETFDLAATDADTVSAAVLGRSGTLRAPTAKVGKTILVGFGEDAWSGVFGG